MKNITVISSYPAKNSVHGKTTVGVASYSKNTLNALKSAAKETISITVLAEKLNREHNYTHNSIRVKRVWSRNTFSIFPNLLKYLWKNKNASTIVIEFELAMFGELLYLIPFPLFLLALRLMQKKIVIVLHQVLPEIESIGPHINLSTHSFKGQSVNISLRLFYATLLLLSNKIIVFEPILKEKLSRFGGIKNVSVIPHGVENFLNKPAKRVARKNLKLKDEFVVVVFGYLAWYKGTDWILNAFQTIKKQKKNSKVRLILAGGANPNHEEKEYYARYIAGLTREVQNLDITITGFIPEEKIADYYQAADAIVLPYRAHMSSSGPLALAFSFKKPFLISFALKEVLNQEDIAEILKKLKIKPETLIFKEVEDFSEKLNNIKKNQKLRQKLSLLSKEIAIKRNWDVIGKKYYEELYS